MSKKFKVWLDSGANCESSYEQIIDLDDLGISDEEWCEMEDAKKESVMREIAFENSDWGFCEVEDDEA